MKNIIIALAILTVSAVNAFSQNWDDVYYVPDRSTTDVYSDADGDTHVTNNYYDSGNQSDFFDDDEYEYFYSSRIRRFHRNNRACNSYYSPYFVDRYYYDADPYYYGSSIYYTPNWAVRVNPVNINIGWFSWGNVFTYNWNPWRPNRNFYRNNYAFYPYNNFNNNFRYNNYYNNVNYYYGYNSGYYGSGYYGGSGYYNGYNNGFNDCYYAGNNNNASYSNVRSGPRGGGRGAGRNNIRKQNSIAQSAEAYTNNDVASVNNNAGFSTAPVPERHLSSNSRDRVRKDYFSEPTIREDEPSRNSNFGGTTNTRSIKKDNSAVREVEDPGYNSDIRSDRSKINNNSTRDRDNTRQFDDAKTERTTRVKDTDGRTRNTDNNNTFDEYIRKEKEQNEYRKNIERERSEKERLNVEKEYQRETERKRSADRERESREKQDRERYDRESRERYDRESREKQDRERYDRESREKQDRKRYERENREKQERSNNNYKKERSQSKSNNRSIFNNNSRSNGSKNSNTRSSSPRSNSSKSGSSRRNSSSKSRSNSRKK